MWGRRWSCEAGDGGDEDEDCEGGEATFPHPVEGEKDGGGGGRVSVGIEDGAVHGFAFVKVGSPEADI